jgi:hypothetical protein
MKFRFLAVALVSMFMALGARAQEFGGSMKQIFGAQYPHYQWLNYPVSDFGIGTAYSDKKAVTDPTKFLCSTFTCLAIDPVPQDTNTCYTSSGSVTPTNCPWATVARSASIYYADVACGTAVDAQLSSNKSLALKAILPILLHAIGLSATVDDSVVSSATITFAKACDRRLLPGPYNLFISKLQSDDFGLKQAQGGKMLIVVRDDIVLTGFEVTVTKDSKLGVDLDAKIQGLPTQAKASSADSATTAAKTEPSPNVSVDVNVGQPSEQAASNASNSSPAASQSKSPSSTTPTSSTASKTQTDPCVPVVGTTGQASNQSATNTPKSTSPNPSSTTASKGTSPGLSIDVTAGQSSKQSTDTGASSSSTNPSAATTSNTPTSPEVSVEYSKDSCGQYHLKSTSPLIIGIAAVKQPGGAGVGPGGPIGSWNGWVATEVQLPSVALH